MNGHETAAVRHKSIVNRHDGSFIFRFRVHNALKNVKISVLDSDGNHFLNSPITIDKLNHADCSCPTSIKTFLEVTKSLKGYTQIDSDLSLFQSISTETNNDRVEQRFCANPGATSLCRYIIKDNKVYRKCHGDHVGFNMFSDDILLQLTRIVKLPDVEFWMNLGDWPMQNKNRNSGEWGAVFSWCGHENFADIVVPTYDIVESTNHMMTKVSRDQFSIQDEGRRVEWNNKIEKAFFRGRDSRQERLDLVEISQKHPELVDAAITAYFFFKIDEEKHGKKGHHVPFYDFFKNKYQINIDGTVAAYRLAQSNYRMK